MDIEYMATIEIILLFIMSIGFLLIFPSFIGLLYKEYILSKKGMYTTRKYIFRRENK